METIKKLYVWATNFALLYKKDRTFESVNETVHEILECARTHLHESN